VKESYIFETPNFRLRQRELHDGEVSFDLLRQSTDGGWEKVAHEDATANWAFLRELGMSLRGGGVK